MGELKIGQLYRVVGALDAVAELAQGLPSPMPPDDGVPLLTRISALGRYALDALDDERRKMLVNVLGPDFFDGDKLPDSFIARASLGVLRGYLHGCLIEANAEAQRDANARAYAEMKVREERGVGFTAPSTSQPP